MTTLYAQPYNINAAGFYFDSAEGYETKAKGNFDRYGQFIDGEQIDCELAKAIGLNQCNFTKFFDLTEEWEEGQKVRFIIAVGEGGYAPEQVAGDPDDIDIDIYELYSLKELAEQFIEEGLFGDIPERLRFYIDHDAIARDLSVDYSETEIAGTRLIYRLG